MRLNRQDYNDVTVLEIHGELDIDSVQTLQSSVSEIIAEARSGIVLDLSSTGFIDSAGLEQLLWARDYCNENNCQLRLAGLDENCTKILEITRLDGQFDCYTELAQAVKSFA
ncbi:MAG: STAS domain-containing protein [Sedimentisphaerales bacterium]|nr:STAS domain-containing protein [Sedimentisphaerales bacterium]